MSVPAPGPFNRPLPPALRRPGVLARVLPLGALVLLQLTCADGPGSPLAPEAPPPAADSGSTGASAAGSGNQAPVAVITEPVSCDSLTCAFDGTGSSDADGSIANYVWRFGNGGIIGGAARSSHTYTYAEAGTYTTVLTVTDDAGATGVDSVMVTVLPNRPPEASFTWSCTALECSFDGGASSDPDPADSVVAWAWSMGDAANTSLSGETVSFTYDEAGEYTVALEVTSSDGATASVAEDVTVEAPASGAPEAVIGPPTGLPKLAPWSLVRNPSLGRQGVNAPWPDRARVGRGQRQAHFASLEEHPDRPSGSGAPAELDPAPVTAEPRVRSSSCPRLTPLESIPSTTPAGLQRQAHAAACPRFEGFSR